MANYDIMETNLRLTQDNDCHWYLVPVNMIEEFNRLLDMEDGRDEPEWDQFEKMSIDGPHDLIIHDYTLGK